VQVLKREGIECIVAPYEADAQLAYLALTGDVGAVITEDSDLLPYGCPTASTRHEASTDTMPSHVDSVCADVSSTS
jgi:5'-3' exonuclease